VTIPRAKNAAKNDLVGEPGVLLYSDAIATACAPNVGPSKSRDTANVESGFNHCAIDVVSGGLVPQPRNIPEAIVTVAALRLKKGFSASLIQTYVENWPTLNLDQESVFHACANVRAAAAILTNCYQRACVKSSQPQIAAVQGRKLTSRLLERAVSAQRSSQRRRNPPR